MDSKLYKNIALTIALFGVPNTLANFKTSTTLMAAVAEKIQQATLENATTENSDLSESDPDPTSAMPQLGRIGMGHISSGHSQSTSAEGLFSNDIFQQPGWKDLHQYGCWCDFENYRLGMGPVMDEFDGFCKLLHDNYVCIIEEVLYAEQSHHCVPDEVEYQALSLVNLIAAAVMMKQFGMLSRAEAHMETVYYHCDMMNKDDICKSGICKAEAKFIYNVQPDVAGYIMNKQYVKNNINPKFVHANGQFDFIGECGTGKPKINLAGGSALPAQSVAGGGNRNPFLGMLKTGGRVKCCGKVPHAVRYNVDSGNHACCESNQGPYVADKGHC